MEIDQFNKAMALAEKDIIIPDRLDTQQLINLSISVSSKYQKWLGVFTNIFSEYEETKLELEKLEGEELKEIRYGKSEKSQYGWKSQSELETQYLSNPKLYDLRAKTNLLKTQCQYLEKTLENIKTYGFQIKNIIEIKKLSYGGI
jgi:hypothetical protein